MKGLSGKTVLVTGGGGAIGRAICARFAEEGAKVLAADRNRQAAETAAKTVNGKALVFDISDYQSAKAAIEEIPIDILVNNAGWDRFQNFADTKPEEWEELIAVNLRGPLNMHHLVLPQMLARGGAQGHHGERRLPGADRHADPARLPRRGRSRAEGLRRAGASHSDEARRATRRHPRHRRLPGLRRRDVHYWTGDLRVRRPHHGRVNARSG